MSGDGAFVDGRVFTGTHYAEAFLVESGRFVAVGTNDEIRRLQPVGCPLRRLAGALVIPGLVDPHLHLASIVRGRHGVPLQGARDLDAVVARIEAWGERHPKGPIVGRGWDEQRLPGHRAPTRQELDRAEGRRPVILYRVCGHAAAVNSVALEAVGALEKILELHGGRFATGDDGRPNGLLYERALDLLQPLLDRMPGVTPAEVRGILGEAASYGLTTVASVNASPDELTAAVAIAPLRDVPTRLRLYLRADRWKPSDGLPDIRPRGEARSLVRGLKAITDGSFGARTAWLEEPYADAPTSLGLPVWADADLVRLAVEVAAQGFSLALHAIGDRALSRALRVFEQTPNLVHPRIEHASLVPRSLVPRLRAFRGSVVIQPSFAVTDDWIPERLGSDRAQGAYAWRTLLAAGVNLAGSSDAPFDELDPWIGLGAAVEGAPWRRTFDAEAAERLSPEEAVSAYTIGGARALGEDGPHGISPGAPADFVVVRAPDLSTAVARRGRDGLETWREGIRVAVGPFPDPSAREGAKPRGV
jgi:predicted amidohydrolase YtcJ